MFVDPVALEEDFRLRVEAYIAFPLELSDTTTREAISYFQVQITNAVKHMDHVCCCCSRFVDLVELNLIPDNEPILMAVFETNILYHCDLDICSCSETFNFCHDCWNQISGGSEPKFGISNKMPQLCYQHYPSMLEDLTSAEEAVIARAHLVITILKLRSNNTFNLRSYRGICGHSVLLPQNPRPLLDLLLSETMPVDEVVKVVWRGKSSPRPKQLSAFVSIRKHRVISALRWLIANNPLYNNIGINYRLLETWDDKFIPSDIMDTMVHCDFNQYKRQGYAIDLCDFENNLDAAIANAGIEGDHINSVCVYSNIYNGRQNPTLCFLSAIGNIKAQAPIPDPPRSDIVTFCTRGQPVPLNDWEDPHYFTFVFPCLFPFGTGGHLE